MAKKGAPKESPKKKGASAQVSDPRPHYDEFDLYRINWGLMKYKSIAAIGAPRLAKRINDFLALQYRGRSDVPSVSVKQVQRALNGERQEPRTMKLFDEFIEETAVMGRSARFAEEVALYLAGMRPSEDQAKYGAPLGVFAQQFCGSYFCSHARWLSQDEFNRFQHNPDMFKVADGETRIAGRPFPQENHTRLWFPISMVQFRPLPAFGGIGVREIASTYVNHASHPEYKNIPMASEGVLSLAPEEDRFLALMRTHEGHDELRVMLLEFGETEEGSRFRSLHGQVLSFAKGKRQNKSTYVQSHVIRLQPHPDKDEVGLYREDDLYSDPEFARLSQLDDGEGNDL